MSQPQRTLGIAIAAILATACTRNDERAQPVIDTATAAAEAAAVLAEECKALATQQIAGVIIRDASAFPFYERPAELDGIEAHSPAEGAKAKDRDEVPLCRVEGVIDGSINFELLLPDQWNGKFLMGGGGGFAGSIQNIAESPEMMLGRTALERGYATAGTDTGHKGSGIDASWALNNPDARANFAHRSIHRTAEISKQIIAAYYPKKLERSYFFGCSGGGGHALILAQRYPQDFDGIVAGAPALDWTGMAVKFLLDQQAVFPDPTTVTAPVITAGNRKLLADALAKSCDSLDGVADGLITDPRRCKFDPTQLPRCTPETAPVCVNKRQLAAIQAIYSDAVIGGERVYPGQPFGGENDPGGWDAWITTPEPSGLPPGIPNLHYGLGMQFAKYFVFDDPQWSYANYDFADWRARTTGVAKLLNATDTDLRKFRDRGGKLILWHGWSDSALPATRTIEYYEAVEKRDRDLRSYARLFMMPGVGHCRGGAGPDQADWIGALEQWVEKGTAPPDISVRRLDSAGATLMERRLCPYPQVPKVDSTGDANTASGYRCGS
jgi:hypothetical protein